MNHTQNETKLPESKLNTIPICTGTGLLALDIILNGSPQTPSKFQAGGSCGNVLTILSYLGWETFPIARLADNNTSMKLLSDLERWKVNTDLIVKKKEGSTPIIIHRISKDKDGKPKHKFEFKDPLTGVWLPHYKPVIAKDVEEIVKKHPIANVFYFDRVNRAAIELAKINKTNGALVVFEPSSISDIKLFRQALEVSHILKFAYDRIKNYEKLFPIQQTKLEIITLGKYGLRYRFSKTKRAKNWILLDSYKLDDKVLLDSVGAGDWCTAGIIASLGKNGIISFNSSKSSDVENALQYGQVLGAINCCFDGARGIMYNIDKETLDKTVLFLQNHNNDAFYKLFSSKLDSQLSYIPQEVISISELY